MRIGIIDADLIGRKKHRFPNLASMKIAGFYKEKGDEVKLLLSYDDIDNYDEVFISKVFTDTPIDKEILSKKNVKYGGTGFFYDKAEPLPYEIEHHMPYYDLYKEWVEQKLSDGASKKSLESYIDYSIGFTTRGCFRHCPFCVNKNYNKVVRHSKVEEFLDVNRKYICLLDDNVLGYGGWREVFNELNNSGKRFQFKQGMDERLLNKEKCRTLIEANYVGDYMFAFDDIEEQEIIKEKLKIWNEVKGKKTRRTKFYTLCGFDKNNKYDEEFWANDIESVFERIKILMENNSIPYVTRYEKYKESPYKGLYIYIAGWGNQPSFVTKKSFREHCYSYQEKVKNKTCAAVRALQEFEEKYPEIANKYFDMKFEELIKDKEDEDE